MRLAAAPGPSPRAVGAAGPGTPRRPPLHTGDGVPDPHLNPTGSKGIGEIGIVGTAAAVASAVHHATGHRFRRLPIGLGQVAQALG